MEVTFLLGAGVSMAVGMPSTKQITDAVLSDPRLRRHSSGAIWHDRGEVPPPRPGLPDVHQSDREKVARFQSYLSCIHARIARQRSEATAPPVTYEDVFYVAKAIGDELTGETNDPTAWEFWLGLRAELPTQIRDAIEEDPGTWRLELERYVRGAVGAFLAIHQPRDLGKLHLFGELHDDPEVETARLFTLNHDTVLEGYLRGQQVPFFDGLGPWDGEVRWLDIAGYGSTSARTLIHKLHGSLDWFFWEPSMRHGSSPKELPKDGLGRTHVRHDPAPRLLVGTLNKAEDYQWDPFREMIPLFVRRLERTSVLVVCGHSFADRVIRGHLSNWIRLDPRRRLIVIDPAAERLKQALSWTVFAGPCDMLSAGIEDITWDSLKDRLAPG